jgi:hypothetical protein
MSTLKRLWNEEDGFVVSAELVLIGTILVIGMIVGLASLRDQVVQELGDVAAAISQIVQSYSYSGITGHTSRIAGSKFDDKTDFCDFPADLEWRAPVCISLCIEPEGEQNW